MSDLGAKALVVEAGSKSPAIEVAQKLGIPVLTLTPDANGVAGVFTLSGGEKTSAAHPGFGDSEDVALILHTSGTTSRPEDRAADAAQCHRLGAEHRHESRIHRPGSRPQHHAALPHPRADRRYPRAAVARRANFLHARASTRSSSLPGWRIASRPGTRRCRPCIRRFSAAPDTTRM